MRINGKEEWERIPIVFLQKKKVTPKLESRQKDWILVPPTRIERAARGLGNRCSIQLSYGGNNAIDSEVPDNFGVS